MVRVAPNELVFITPKAYTGMSFPFVIQWTLRVLSRSVDIYTSTMNGRPAFVKSDMLDTGDKYEGLASERDIDKHRAARKQLAPAFSPRSLRQYEPTIHAHVDELIHQLERSPATQEGVEISRVQHPTNAFNRVQAKYRRLVV